LIKNIRDLFFFTIGLLQSVFYLLRFKIDVVFCKGGYVALPVVFAAKLLGKKIIVHESDVHPGLVNRIAGKSSAKNFSGFP
jgi:UDP-N-acetylglucosamine--N-acetylmuramyl-(pentapeptide) pyrophosphoryl-undecaprenol N-acetylglucosamine transferase